MDVAAIEPGRDFRKVIDQSVSTCSVLLAIIGQEWLVAKNDAGSRRLEDQNDFVRIELASALRRDIPVIPILVRGAKMPRPEQLPDDLKELAYRNAVELSHARWKTDVQVLLQALRPYIETPQMQAPVVARMEQPARPDSSRSAPAQSAPAPRVTGTAAGTQIVGAQNIDRISRELAVYIGPIADVIVKQAAKRCSSIEELCTSVAREIEDGSNRAKFLRACRT